MCQAEFLLSFTTGLAGHIGALMTTFRSIGTSLQLTIQHFASRFRPCLQNLLFLLGRLSGYHTIEALAFEGTLR